jgi:hypothetical protein
MVLLFQVILKFLDTSLTQGSLQNYRAQIFHFVYLALDPITMPYLA